MTNDGPGAPGVRSRVRDAIKSELTDAAVEAFRTNGFDKTTVDEIVAQVGVSKRTFFRYFSSKEDAVLQPLENLGHAVAQELAQRPPMESPRVALRYALDVLIGDCNTSEDRWRSVIELNRTTPSVRSRHLLQQDMWLDQMAPLLAARMDVHETDARPRLYCSILLTAFETGLKQWLAGRAHRDLAASIDDVVSSLDGLLS